MKQTLDYNNPVSPICVSKLIKRLSIGLTVVLLIAGWMVYFHNDGVVQALAAVLPKSAALQKAIAKLGKAKTVEAGEQDPDTLLNEIPVHTAPIATGTMSRYVEGFGSIVPRPSRLGEMAGSANIASPVQGVVAKVLCQIGQAVHAGDPLIQLDDRVAKAAEDQAEAALAQARASQAALKATPRPDQLQIAQLAVDKGEGAVQFAQRNFDRQSRLATEQGASSKTVEQAALDLASAKTDLAVAQRQLAILKASPTPEDLAQEQAKVAQATAALAAAHAQRQLLTIAAPIDATVVSLSVNPGEAVDPTRPLVQLMSMDRLMVDVDVPAEQLPANAVGLSALISPPAAAGTKEAKTITGKIAFVTPQVDARNGAVLVGVDLPAGSGLPPGLAVRVRIIAATHDNCFTVPRNAVVADENGDSVIALVEKGKDGHQMATRKIVKPGFEEDGQIEIEADDLKEGATVVTAGAFGLPQAGRVKVQN